MKLTAAMSLAALHALHDLQSAGAAVRYLPADTVAAEHDPNPPVAEVTDTDGVCWLVRADGTTAQSGYAGESNG